MKRHPGGPRWRFASRRSRLGAAGCDVVGVDVRRTFEVAAASEPAELAGRNIGVVAAIRVDHATAAIAAVRGCVVGFGANPCLRGRQASHGVFGVDARTIGERVAAKISIATLAGAKSCVGTIYVGCAAAAVAHAVAIGHARALPTVGRLNAAQRVVGIDTPGARVRFAASTATLATFYRVVHTIGVGAFATAIAHAIAKQEGRALPCVGRCRQHAHGHVGNVEAIATGNKRAHGSISYLNFAERERCKAYGEIVGCGVAFNAHRAGRLKERRATVIEDGAVGARGVVVVGLNGELERAKRIVANLKAKVERFAGGDDRKFGDIDIVCGFEPLERAVGKHTAKRGRLAHNFVGARRVTCVTGFETTASA